MKVAVIGATGQLGSELVTHLRGTGAYEVTPLAHADIECANADSVAAALDRSRPEVVVNCAAFVRVDECEDRPGEAFATNALGALNVARSAARRSARCVYVSTDYVFDGHWPAPYTEEDAPGPINVYGASKLAGEYLVRQACPDWLIVRLASLFGRTGARGKRGNFVDTILERAARGERLRVVHDVRMSPTYAVDAAHALEALIRRDARGVFHAANAGSCSWYEFAVAALRLTGLSIPIEPVAAAEYPMRARRPANSALSSERLAQVTGVAPRPWEEALAAYLRETRH